jgi:hypothetical protein
MRLNKPGFHIVSPLTCDPNDPFAPFVSGPRAVMNNVNLLQDPSVPALSSLPLTDQFGITPYLTLPSAFGYVCSADCS